MTDTLERLTLALADRYRLERELGQGGMATVYLAEDLKHHRQVAIKVLRPELSALLGAERFLKEIETTANLQHPHILPLHDSGSADGLLFYVMPYVSGESLRQKLTREKQLGIEEAVRITTQVANALDYAHRQNVIHRDIKPENILLSEGQALIADFGIALALRQAGGSRLTETGLSLGTPQYMSPEQATGDRQLDARSDIYSLGCVLYEMLAGEPPHTGPTVQAVIARVVSEEPRPISLQRKAVPPHVEAAVLTALEKLPADRFASAAEFAGALGNPGYGGPVTASGAVRRGAERSSAPARALSTVVTVAAVVTLALLAAWGWFRALQGRTGEASTRHWSIVLPDSAPLAFVGEADLAVGRPALALSPDGSVLAYVALVGSGTELRLMHLDEGTTRSVPGSNGAYLPFFAPDGRRVGFFAHEELKKAEVGGGDAVTISRVDNPYGAIWMRDGRILLCEYFGRRLSWVNEAGGTPAVLGAQPEVRVVLPVLLPDGDHVLHSIGVRMLFVTSLRSGESQALSLEGLVSLDSSGTSAAIVGTTPQLVGDNLILFRRGDALMALPFDAREFR
ncbi:MAG: serine/threonine-protein kinase, partial [Gemmatimonadota bacterium]|nr:serine/threonine-protein kinase [Gemmatimonadota bacterium]